jgi:hypothetical protein
MIDISTSIRSAMSQRVDKQIASNGMTREDLIKGAPEGTVHDPRQLRSLPGSLEMVVKDCGDWLERNYPGWAWVLQPNLTGQVVNLFSYRLHSNWAVIMHIDKIQEWDIRQKWLPRYAGELLERFGLPRVSFERARSEYMAKDRDFQGFLIPDVVGSVTKLTKNQKLEIAMREGHTTFHRDGQGREYLRIAKHV